ncbi:MAG: MBL fold metallo-hydrolase [Propionibacteriaceae bacterium]|jgi:L-ascorbate metabolism protein UlaG (beta-lactamase superfamily)|nr:MBL fold metallo-hydrolase [Propionibacteriaceae bacterium]
MKIAHLGHACVLVETATTRILFDPGNFSNQWHDLEDLEAIVVTHAHPDHIDPVNIAGLLALNPQAQILVEPAVLEMVPLPSAQALTAGSTVDLGAVRLEAVGGLHALIHRDIPQIGNIGVVVREPAEPTFCHPGDALDVVPTGIDILATPAHGPWCAMKETIDFVRAVGAKQGFLIHDGLINERGWSLTFNRLNEMTPTRFLDLRATGLVDLVTR